jgi:hypothetical protein
MKRLNNKGFSHVVLVSVLVYVLIAAGAIVYKNVYKNQLKSTTSVVTTTTSATVKNPTSTARPNQNVVKILELGIQITVPDSIKSIKYAVNYDGYGSDNSHYPTANFTVSTGCSIGTLAKINGQYDVVTKNINTPIGGLVMQSSTYFISSGHPQAACSDNTAIENTFELEMAAFFASLKTIVAL